MGIFKRFNKKAYKNNEVFPDEIFLDSHNLPQFDRHNLEGHIEKTISKRAVYAMGIFFAFVFLVFAGKAWVLQVLQGTAYAEKSENNRLDHELVFAERGLLYDRNRESLAWNIPSQNDAFTRRMYVATSGFAHALGYVSYPKKDKQGNYFDDELIGKSGVEAYYNSDLQGKNGIKITETNALQNKVSESVLRPPEHGSPLHLSIDNRIQAKLYEEMKGLAERVGFQGGAAAIMNIHTGEMIAYTSFPEFSSHVMTEGEDATAVKGYLTDSRNVFINRLVDGLYTPGSIVKPFVAIGALEEKTIDPGTFIISTGQIEVKNPYNPDQVSVFTDWKAHGAVDMRRAIAVSSNVYFYEVGGGFGNIKGLGITKLEKYMRMFGFGSPLSGFFEGKAGTVPNPEWKKQNFDGDDWRLGDTYFTSIGQYGFQTSPLQALRAVAAISNGGKLIEPTILKSDGGEAASSTQLNISQSNLKVIHEGMRLGAIEGTAKALNVPYVEIAAKTGTAELGVSKAKVNSWNMGFWPYRNPKYAFLVMMEKGDRTNTIGSVYVMRQLFDWMHIYAPEYLN